MMSAESAAVMAAHVSVAVILRHAITTLPPLMTMAVAFFQVGVTMCVDLQ